MGWSGAPGSQSFSRTNGFNSGADTWQQDDAESVGVTSGRHDTHDQDLADGINACLKKDGGNTATANLPMGGFRHTNVGDAAARTQYASFGQVQDGDAVYYPTVGGTVDAITLSGAGAAITAYAAGQSFRFLAAGANTSTTPTVNVDGVGVKTIARNGGSACVAGDIASGAMVTIEYDGTNFQLRAAGYTSGGQDVAIADGGTGASTATAAFDNLAPTTTRGDIIYHNGTDNARLAVGTADQVLKTDGTDPSWGKIVNANITDATIEFAKLTSDAVALIPGVLLGLIEDRKSAGTGPGSLTSDAWTKRDLNTETYDRLGIISLASNQFTISAAGTYEIEWESPFYSNSGAAKTRLYNTTAGSEVDVGTQGDWTGGTGATQFYSRGIARVTVASSTAFEIQYHQSGTSGGTDANKDGKQEIYTRVIIRRG